MDQLLAIMAFIFGLMVGSFLNALIYRLPRGINIALPRSACPQCSQTIKWYHNIPVLSYVFLRGRCAYCSKSISIMYPLVEILAAVMAYVMAPRSIDPIELFNFIFFFGVFCAFVVHFIVDLKHQILPDSVNIYLALLFLFFCFFTKPWTHWLIGGALGLLFPLIVSWIFYQLRGQIGLGGGDIKLYAVLGIYLGPIAIMQNIFLSCFLGALIGILLMALKIIKKENPIPFGPFIIVVASVQIFFKEWFNQLMRYIA